MLGRVENAKKIRLAMIKRSSIRDLGVIVLMYLIFHFIVLPIELYGTIYMIALIAGLNLVFQAYKLLNELCK